MTTDNHHNELPHKPAAAPKSYDPKAPAPEPELEDNHNNEPVGRRPPSAPKQYTPKAQAPEPELEDNHRYE